MEEAVTEILGHNGNLTTSIISLCVIFTVFIVIKVVEILWKVRSEKDVASEKSIKELTKTVDENTATMKALDLRLKGLEEKLEKNFSALPKMQEDLRRYYTGLKLLAGKKWATIRKELDDETHTV